MTAYEQALIDAGRGHLIGRGRQLPDAYYPAGDPIGEGPRLYRLDGWNGMRRIEFTMLVRATTESEAVHVANQWRAENNKVRAESWRTREVTPEPEDEYIPSCGPF